MLKIEPEGRVFNALRIDSAYVNVQKAIWIIIIL